MKRIDLTGKRFGSLVVIGRAHRAGQFWHWECRCDCGATSVPSGANLRTGHTLSCGCARLAANIKHGMADRPEYGIWRGIIARCRCETNKAFRDYGGRGIQVCERWDRFENFLSDMGCRPDANLTIERKNNAGNYEPGNCLWATRTDQNRNKRKKRNNTSGVNGVTWSKAAGKWMAAISHESKQIYLGVFVSLEDAAAARQSAEQHFGYSPEHGR